ncbi:hypothetical protein CL621_01445 [archaeon]|nr:hypothetical protein [archaeon]|tara:strand:+ start:336 stop:560 length:225 start_codon:yes stop_codon:yes gene_type:complete
MDITESLHIEVDAPSVTLFKDKEHIEAVISVKRSGRKEKKYRRLLDINMFGSIFQQIWKTIGVEIEDAFAKDEE